MTHVLADTLNLVRVDVSMLRILVAEASTPAWKGASRFLRNILTFCYVFGMLYHHYPFHRAFLNRMGVSRLQKLVLIAHALSKPEVRAAWYRLRYQRWSEIEYERDGPKEISIEDYDKIRTSPPFPLIHLNSFCPRRKREYSITKVYITYTESGHEVVSRLPTTKSPHWVQYYATHKDHLSPTEMDPKNGMSATNPKDGHLLVGTGDPLTSKNISNFDRQYYSYLDAGGAVKIPKPWKVFSVPTPREIRDKDEIDTLSAVTGCTDGLWWDEDQQHALLEWIADPPAALARRMKSALSVSKKERKALIDFYAKRQKYEIAVDEQRRLQGTTMAEDWEIGMFEGLMEARREGVQLPVWMTQTEEELWKTYHACFDKLDMSEKNKFVESLAGYAYKLAVDAATFARRKELENVAKGGEEPKEQKFFTYRDNHDDPRDNPLFAQLPDHVREAFKVLPVYEGFDPSLQLATMVIGVVKHMGQTMAEEAKKAITELVDGPGPIDRAVFFRMLKDVEEAYELMDTVATCVGMADKLAAEAMRRAIKAGMWDAESEEEEIIDEDWEEDDEEEVEELLVERVKVEEGAPRRHVSFEIPEDEDIYGISDQEEAAETTKGLNPEAPCFAPGGARV